MSWVAGFVQPTVTVPLAVWVAVASVGAERVPARAVAVLADPKLAVIVQYADAADAPARTTPAPNSTIQAPRPRRSTSAQRRTAVIAAPSR